MPTILNKLSTQPGAGQTARHRALCSHVVILNPFGVLGIPSSGFNPLMALDPESETFVDDAMGVGEALIKIEGHDPHWSESAQGLLVAFIMWEVQEAQREHRVPLLENVRMLLTEADEYEIVDGHKRQIKGLNIITARMCAHGGYEIASLVGRFIRENNEVAGVQSTADRQTTWMLSRPMRADLGRDGIDFSDLKRRPVTVYVILPAERLRTHSVWLRLIIISALRSLYKPGGLQTLFMIDEFASVGRLGPIEDAFGLVRGYGVQLWLILQDLNQLKSLYKDRWETFVGNAGIVQGFAPNDMTTADWMSQRAGDTTVVAAGFNRGGNTNKDGEGGSTNEGLSHQQTKRRLFLPQELLGMPEGAGLLWAAGSSLSIPFFGPNYRQEPRYADRADPNPYYQPRS